MKTPIVVFSLIVIGSAAALACEPGKRSRGDLASAPVVVSPGKAVAAIDVRHTLSGKPQPGNVLALELVFESRDGQALDVSLKLPAALGPAAPSVRQRLASGEPMVLELIALREGRFYVDAIARPAEGSAFGRAVSIPVQIGASTGRLSKAERTPDGELLVRMRTD